MRSLLTVISFLSAGVGCSGGASDAGRLEEQAIQITPGGAVRLSTGAIRYAQASMTLPSGSILILDSGTNSLVELPPTGPVNTVVRDGSGPFELRRPIGLFRWRADSLAILDSHRRLIVLGPSGTLVRETVVIPPDPSARLRAAGSDGRLFFEQLARGRGPKGESRVVLVVADEIGGMCDTLLELLGPRWIQTEVRQTGTGRASNTVIEVPQPGSPQDDWVLAGQERIVVLRVTDYSVAAYDMGGRALWIGPSNQYHPRIYQPRDNALHGTLGLASSGVDIPTHHPPFERGGALVWTETGETWVQREDDRGKFFYDVFDGDGIRIESVRFPSGGRVIGFDPEGVIVAEPSLDGFDAILRYSGRTLRE